MRLSDFENDKALDLLADIIEPASEIMSDARVIEVARSKKPVIFVVREILKNHKKSAIEIVAAMHGESPETYRFNILTLTADVLDIMNDPNMHEVFYSQSQPKENASSGSVTESIEESEQ